MHNARDEDCLKFEDTVWFELNKAVFKEHRNAYEMHLLYLTSDIMHPYKWTVDQTINRVRWMYLIMKYLQPSSREGQKANEANWDSLRSPKDEKFIRNAIYNCMPPFYRNKLRRDYHDWRSMEQTEWTETLRTIERWEKIEAETRTDHTMCYSSPRSRDSDSDERTPRKKKQMEVPYGRRSFQ